MLEVRGLQAGYRPGTAVLSDIDLDVRSGAGTGIVGRNGAGKTCLALTLMGIHRAQGGSLELDGEDVTRASTRRRCNAGIALVPEGRLVFGQLSVTENLVAAGYGVGGRVGAADLRAMHERFPILAEKADAAAESMSGGEQQMLAIARCLIQRPKVLVLDEPSLGLSPVAIEALATTVRGVQEEGVAILLLEQNRFLLERLCEDVHILDRGGIARTVRAEDLDDTTMIGASIGIEDPDPATGR